MSDFLSYLILFVTATILAFIYFVSRREEPANIDPTKQIAERIGRIEARISVLEKQKLSKIELVELSDAIKQVMKDHQEIKRTIGDFAFDFNTTVTRLIASFRRSDVKRFGPRNNEDKTA